MQLTVGNVIDDRYEIVCPIASGGFAVVYKAYQKQFDRMVAIKLLDRYVMDEDDAIPRFEREARAVSALRHRNVVGMYGYGVWQGAPYMVMELVDGPSLHTVIRAQEKLAPKRAARLMAQVCHALDEAHKNGIVHRDLKPQNIMITKAPDGTELVKIIDFGLAKLMPGYGLSAQKLTETGQALGTCTYMAPEQCTGALVDARADIYSVGCLLYECVTGGAPFDADANVAVMFMHINEVHKPVNIAGLDQILARALAKNPDERYASASEMADDLSDFAAGKTPRTAGSTRIARPRLGKPKNLKLSLALVAVVSLAVLAYPLILKKNEPAMAPTAGSLELYRMGFESVRRDKPGGDLLQAALVANESDRRLDAHRLVEVYSQLTIENLNARSYQKALRYAQQCERLTTAHLSDEQRLFIVTSEAECLNHLGRSDQAIAMMEDLIRSAGMMRNPDIAARAHFALAQIHSACGNQKAAVVLLNKAIADNPVNDLRSQARTTLGVILIQEGRYQEALDALRAAKEEYPGNTRPQCDGALVRVLLLLKKYEEAQKVALAIGPEEIALSPPERCSIYLLQIAAAARARDRATAVATAGRLIAADRSKISDWNYYPVDQTQCRDALKAAAYTDLLSDLRSAFPGWKLQ
jgi:serine/threonine protein kinase